jgi:hypothetical protein
MTNKGTSNGKDNDKRRFPSGMTNKGAGDGKSNDKGKSKGTYEVIGNSGSVRDWVTNNRQTKDKHLK